MTRITCSLVLILALISCKTSKSADKTKVDFRQVATMELGEEVRFSENSSKNFVLCQSVIGSTDPTNTTFVVIEKKTGKILIPKTQLRGKVAWYNETRLVILEISGVLKDKNSTPADQSYHLDVITGRKVSTKI